MPGADDLSWNLWHGGNSVANGTEKASSRPSEHAAVVTVFAVS